ncbi:WW domain-containing protein ZK1098.1-like [Cynara cardunculus var. scolymus]|nr:WW domain-containing protein ZK1098.1-like [Cynara cardunculus var. scolymus]
MKTVSGTIISSKPVNISKAASILSNFVNSDNGASQSVSTYLRRTSTAFNELVSFRKHHKRKKHQPMEEDSSKSDVKPRNSEEDEVRVLENGGGVNRKFDHDPVEEKENDVEGKLEKKKKKKKKEKGGLGKSGVFEEDNEIVKEKKKKKRKNAEVEGDESGNSKKKKKRSRTEADE